MTWTQGGLSKVGRWVQLTSIYIYYILKLEIADTGEACLNCLLKDKNANDNNFDIVIIKTHLIDKSGLDIAKEIHKTSPNQRIVIISTSSIQYLSKEQLDFAGIDQEEILTIPFRFSHIMSLLKLI